MHITSFRPDVDFDCFERRPGLDLERASSLKEERAVMHRNRLWAATLMRGVLAFAVGSAVFVVPEMSKTLLLLPFAIVGSIFLLGIYGVADSAIVYVTSFFVDHATPKNALRFQGVFGVLIGIAIALYGTGLANFHYFLYLITFQALCTSVAEFVVARHTLDHRNSVWNYAASAIAFIFMLAYAFAGFAMAEVLTYHDMTWLIYAYLFTFGLGESVTAVRMLGASGNTTKIGSAAARDGYIRHRPEKETGINIKSIPRLQG